MKGTETMVSNQLQVVNRADAPTMTQPQQASFEEIWRMANAVAKSGLFGMKAPEQAFALMMLAQAEGMHPMIAARDYDIIQGRPSKKAEAMLRDFQRSGGKVEWHELTDTKADATFSHPQGGAFRCDWDLKRANAAGLGSKEMWKKYPRQMLRARCVSEGCKTVFPSSTSGMYTPEEVQDFEPSGASAGQSRVEAYRAQVSDMPPLQAPVEPDAPTAAPKFELVNSDGEILHYDKLADYLNGFRLALSTAPDKAVIWSDNAAAFEERLGAAVQAGAAKAVKAMEALRTEVNEMLVPNP